jgi:sensor histidine kinase regulating citrate/malate metabolism
LPNQDQKGMILIAFKYISNQLQIKIEDNGIGIENSIGRKVQDSGDHKSQGTEITLKRVELIRKISGKTIHIDGPNQRNDVSGNSIGTEVTIFIDQNLLN